MRQVIHIPDKKVDVINHLKNQPNMSGYIVKLIEKDMKNELLTREKIIELIKEHSGKVSNQMDQELLNSINSTLDF